MKKLILPIAFLLLAFSSVDNSIELKDTYKVFQDGVLMFEHNNAVKVIDSAKNIKAINKSSKVLVTQPDLEVIEADGGNLIASIKIETYDIKPALIVNNTSATYFGQDCNSNSSPMLIISEQDFDFKGEPIRLKNCIWYIQKGLFNNGVALSVDEAINQNLIIKTCDTSVIIKN